MALVAAGLSGALGGDAGRSDAGGKVGSGVPGGAGSFDAPADMRLCLGDAVAKNLAVNPDAYDAAQVTVYPREWAFYDPAEGIVPLTGATEFFYATYYVAHSPVGEEFVDLPDGNLNQCGTSYEDGGYKWGARETTQAGRASPSASPQPGY